MANNKGVTLRGDVHFKSEIVQTNMLSKNTQNAVKRSRSTYNCNFPHTA